MLLAAKRNPSGQTRWCRRAAESLERSVPVEGGQEELLDAAQVRQVVGGAAAHPGAADAAGGRRDVGRRVGAEGRPQRRAHLGLVLFQDRVSGELGLLLVSEAVDEQPQQVQALEAQRVAVGRGRNEGQPDQVGQVQHQVVAAGTAAKQNPKVARTRPSWVA